ncbi:MAG: AAA family ATPase, partial [Candidatus Micrarchaeota archaeon]
MENEDIFNILLDTNLWRKELASGIERTELLQKLERVSLVEEVTVISGVRRCGKSTLLLQFAKRLIEKGVKKENILYVNFEEPRFLKLDLELMNKVYAVYRERVNP